MSGEAPPPRLGRYELRSTLGRGAMGIVYRAYDAVLDRTVALKTYRQDLMDTGEARRRFEREVRTASKLSHPNVVVVYDGGVEGEVPFLAMELLEGRTLEAELKARGRLPVSESLSILFSVGEALTYAHSMGVIHRDLKPANVFLTADGRLKILDFGIAKIEGSGTATTVPIGTPSYMSPEQVHGQPIDARADVFAVGILAYELLTGVTPFRGDSLTAVLFSVVSAEPMPPTTVDPSLPAALDGVIARALAKDPATRLPTIAALVDELAAAFGVRATATEEAMRGALAVSVAAPAAEPPRAALDTTFGSPPAPTDAPEPEPEPVAARRPSPLVAAGIGVPVLVAAGVAGWLWLRDRPATEPVPPPAATPAAGMAAVPPGAPAPAAVPPTPLAEAPEPPAAPTAAPEVALAPPPEPEPAEPERPPAVEPTAPRPPAREAARRRAAIERERSEPRPSGTPSRSLRNSIIVPERGDQASVTVTTDPPGVELFIDGTGRARTPNTVEGLAPGSHEVELRSGGRTVYRKTVRLPARSKYQLNVDLDAE